MRYAPNASREFNSRFDAALQRLRDDVCRTLGPDLVALVLGGGYGRGEGAVVRREGIEHPYNDLDLMIVVRNRWGFDARGLDQVRVRHEAVLGIEIDIGRPLTIQDIERWPCALMWQDLLVDHVVLHGPRDVLTAHAPARVCAPLPPIEATRLLLNRGAGVLWSLRILRRLEEAADPDFVRRNFYKCALALGDALLIAHRRFVNRCDEREARLQSLLREAFETPPVHHLYASAIRFKLCPDGLPARRPTEDEVDALARDWWRVFLHVERTRTRRTWQDAETYQDDGDLREPPLSTPSRWARNLVHNLRCGRISARYPRERLYRDLPALLLRREATGWAQQSAAFLRVWKQVN